MGMMIREARLERKLPAQALAERAGISRSLLQRIEKGDPNCTIGVVFELAYLLGIPLFSQTENQLASNLASTKEKLALLPKAARKPSQEVDDEF